MKFRTPLLAVLSVLAAPQLGSTQESEPRPDERAQDELLRLPLAFEENVGQTDDSVRFIARSAPYTLFLTPAETVFRIRTEERDAVVRMRVAGSSGARELTGETPLEGTSRYFLGGLDEQGQTARHFGRVVANEVLPGIDQVFYGTDQRVLEYDFVVSPHADPSAIEVLFDGVQGTSLEDGELVLTTEAGELRKRAPFAYQVVAGERHEVECSYELTAGGFRFQLGAWDPELELVIDPMLTYGTFLGGSGVDMAWDMQVFGGTVFVCGSTASSNFPTGNNRWDNSANGGEDAFVTVFNPITQSWPMSSTYLGGNGNDRALAIAVDGAGLAHITGYTESTNFPTTSTRLRGSATRQGFVAIISPYVTGNQALNYSTYFGGNGTTVGYDIEVDPGVSFNHVVGYTRATNFPVTKNATQSHNAGGADMFLLVNSQYNDSFPHASYFGGSGDDYGREIELSGNAALLAGWTWSSNYPTTNGAYDRSFNGVSDGFCTKLWTAGGLAWSTLFGGSDFELVGGMTLTPGGLPVIVGGTKSSNFPTTAGAYDRSYNHGQWGDAYMLRFDATGQNLGYSTFFGGSGSDCAGGVVVDGFNNYYVTGHCDSSNLPMKNAFQGSKRGAWEGWVAKFRPANSGSNALVWSSYFGSSGNDAGFQIDHYQSAVYVGGYAGGTNFTTLNNPIDGSFNGGSYDGAVLVMTQN